MDGRKLVLPTIRLMSVRWDNTCLNTETTDSRRTDGLNWHRRTLEILRKPKSYKESVLKMSYTRSARLVPCVSSRWATQRKYLNVRDVIRPSAYIRNSAMNNHAISIFYLLQGLPGHSLPGQKWWLPRFSFATDQKFYIKNTNIFLHSLIDFFIKNLKKMKILDSKSKVKCHMLRF